MVYYQCLIRSSDRSALASRSPGFLLSASGLTTLDLGWQIIRKLNQERNLDHQTYCWFRALVVVKYLRFLWSMITSKGSCVPWSSGLHSSRALTIARSSLSQISQLHSQALCCAKKQAIGRRRPLLLYQERIPPNAQSEASVSRTVFLLQLKRIRTRVVAKATQSLLKVTLQQSRSQDYGVPFFIRPISGIAILEKSQINQQQKLINPRNF